MSSFIRQLNKYDFHKVKPASDSDNNSPLGNVGLAPVGEMDLFIGGGLADLCVCAR